MTVSAGRLAAIFVELADTLGDDFQLLDFLQMLTDRTATMATGSDVGLMLADSGGRLEFMAASSAPARLTVQFQAQHREGPCVDAFHSGRPVVDVDVAAAAGRWPLFAPRAAALGFHSVHAFPMRLRTEVIGALNVFGTRPGGGLTEPEMLIMQALADAATIGLLHERAIRRGAILVEQLQHALDSRIVIEQAKGVVAQLRGISVDEAFRMIRAYARGHNRQLAEVAHAIVTDPGSLSELAGRERFRPSGPR